jgi:hypothetical protein
MKIKLLVTLLSFAVLAAWANPSLACDCDKDKIKTPAVATTAAAPAATTPKPTFEDLKKLSGNWEITMTENGKKEVAKASYEVTSGGNVVLEKIFIGTDHEMVSVYNTDGSTVAMTHYCMLPNTPRMTLTKTEPGKMFFEMKGKDGIKSKKEHHMRSVELAWNNNNELTQSWISMKDGKLEPATTFTWKRSSPTVAKK